MRIRAGVVISNGDKVLLMHRRNQGRECFIIPGGGVEPVETIRQAAIREAQDQKEHYFEVTGYSGEPRFGDEELKARPVSGGSAFAV